MHSKPKQPPSDGACRVCCQEDDEAFLVLCDGCDAPFHTYCHNGCMCCNQKPRGTFNRKPPVPEGDWFCKLCAGRLPTPDPTTPAISSVFVWGDNEDHQLGLGDIQDTTVWSPRKLEALNQLGIQAISCSETSTLVLGNDGNVYSVGAGINGQLGHQDMVHEKLKYFRKIESLMEEKRTKNEGRITQICSGRDFCAIVTSEGHMYTWGNGESGQLGHQENKIKKAPKKISALRELEIPVDLATCGADFILCTSQELKDDSQFKRQKPGVFMSMGGNMNGQLADGSARNQWVPQLLNKDGPELTNPAHTDMQDPREFLLGRDIKQLAAGNAHGVAVVANTRGLWSWGYGEMGQLGHPKPEIPPDQSRFFRAQFRVPFPRFVHALQNETVAQVCCGSNHTLVLLASGKLMAMGSNELGQLGIPNNKKKQQQQQQQQHPPQLQKEEKHIVELPTEVTALKDHVLKQIACGADHSVVLTVQGHVLTWGSAQYGQLGLGDAHKEMVESPQRVEPLPRIEKVFCGPNQVFAIEFTDDAYRPPAEPFKSKAKTKGKSTVGKATKKGTKTKATSASPKNKPTKKQRKR